MPRKIQQRQKKKKKKKKNRRWRYVDELWLHCQFFQFMATLKQSGSHISNAWSVILTFSLVVTFYLTKSENRTKNVLTQILCCCFEYRYYFFVKKCWTFANKCWHQQKRESWYWSKLFLKLKIWVYLRTKFQFSSIILTSFRQGVILPPSQPQNKPLKGPPRLGLKSSLLPTFSGKFLCKLSDGAHFQSS